MQREGREAEQQIDQRLARHDGDQPHQGEGDKRAADIAEDNVPAHKFPPEHPAPAVGGHLRRAEDDHGRGDIEKQQQQAEQDDAARHAENAGEKRRRQNGGGDERDQARTDHAAGLARAARNASWPAINSPDNARAIRARVSGTP